MPGGRGIIKGLVSVAEGGLVLSLASVEGLSDSFFLEESDAVSPGNILRKSIPDIGVG